MGINQLPASKAKYHNVKVQVDGFRFDSVLEARTYAALKLLRDVTKEVRFFLRQVPFHLPGSIIYRLDFQVHYTNGQVRHLDSKGVETKEFKLKKRLVEATYPVQIEQVRSEKGRLIGL